MSHVWKDKRLGERFAITDLQGEARRLGEIDPLAGAAIYEQAAARWEALGQYSDFASDARAAARRLRREAAQLNTEKEAKRA